MRRLPLLVLQTVLFPGAQMPLHVFEPRYRRLVARCLESDRRFGVVYHDSDCGGPFIAEEGGVGCVGEIVEFKPLPDGRSLLLVEGRDRFRIMDGIEADTPYYEAVVEPYEDVVPAGIDLAGRRRGSIQLFSEVVDQAVDPAVPRPELDAGVETSFRLAERIQMEVVWRQALLESRSEPERLDRVDAVLRAVLNRYEDGR